VVDLSEAIRLKSDESNDFSNRGIAYANLKQYQNAISDYTEAIRLEPEGGQAYYNRSIAYRVTGNVRQAESDLAKAKKFGFRN
jgi:Flp pilus assembly protein TadD